MPPLGTDFLHAFPAGSGRMSIFGFGFDSPGYPDTVADSSPRLRLFRESCIYSDTRDFAKRGAIFDSGLQNVGGTLDVCDLHSSEADEYQRKSSYGSYTVSTAFPNRSTYVAHAQILSLPVGLPGVMRYLIEQVEVHGGCLVKRGTS